MSPIEHVWYQMGVWIRDVADASSNVPECDMLSSCNV